MLEITDDSYIFKNYSQYTNDEKANKIVNNKAVGKRGLGLDK